MTHEEKIRKVTELIERRTFAFPDHDLCEAVAKEIVNVVCGEGC
jgi:hypothetical protein